MRKEDGLSIISLIITIVILVLIAGFVGNKIFGKDGIVEKYKESENNYNKAEIVDKLNQIIREKYVLDYQYAVENKLKPEEYCTADNFFKYLLDCGYIEQLKDINDNLVQDQYYIIPESLHGNLAMNAINENGSESNGTKVYKIKKLENRYMIYFVDKYGEEEELGELIMNPDIK
ncbi:MAG: hypothetical protein IJW20_02290 [Clostridia bacterium]|nr:hypothetical protein [Clostridia bacterium]